MTVTVAGITESLRIDTSDPMTWSSFNAASPHGVVVLLAHGTESTDLVVGVTYGTAVLQRCCTAVDTTTEPGRSYAYFWGSGIPTGVQTITVDLTSGTTTDIFGAAYSLDGAANLMVIDSDTRDNNAAADPTILTLQYAGRSSMAFAVCYSGVTANTTLTVHATSTKDSTTDLAGNFTCGVQHQTTAGTADYSIQWGGVGVDDLAFATLAVTEVIAIPGPLAMMSWF